MKICLIVSGDAQKRQNIRDTLEELGFIVHEASNEQSASMAIHALLPDAIIFDNGMAGAGGDNFKQKHDSLKSGKKPALFLFANPDRTDIRTVAIRFLREGLLDERVRVAMGLEIKTTGRKTTETLLNHKEWNGNPGYNTSYN